MNVIEQLVDGVNAEIEPFDLSRMIEQHERC